MKKITRIASGIVLVLVAGVVAVSTLYVLSPQYVDAQETVEDLRKKIDASQKAIEAIEKEIRQYESQLNQVGAEKKTLQNAIYELDLSRKKLQTELQATEKRINSTDLEIQELEREIYIKELEIERNQDAIAQSFRTMDQMERQTLVEMLLSFDSLAEVWDAIAAQATLQQSLQDDVHVLAALKDEYEHAKDRSLDKRDELDSLKNDLSGEKRAVDNVRTEKDQLLDQTENEEARYQRILAEKRAAREAFEKAIADFESQIQFILDPATIPAAGSGVLRFPFETSLMASCAQRSSVFGNSYCLTQYFGNTAFAQSGAYNGKGHNGIDFGVPTGTKILAALGGTVAETGNTDQYAGCLSYGKWVLVRHGNGLATLYAHLSSINVSAGQAVNTGQILGYSGNTGYSTGPHLHFTVYANKGVEVVPLGDVKAITSCGPARVPVAGFEAYLNPLDYL